MSIPDFSTPEAMRGVLERIVRRAGAHSNSRNPRWAHVSDITGHGSGYSADICREFGFDPDELTGGLKDEIYCNECGHCQGCGSHEEVEHEEDCEADSE